MKTMHKFHEDGISFDYKEVLILLFGHLGSAGIGLQGFIQGGRGGHSPPPLEADRPPWE